MTGNGRRPDGLVIGSLIAISFGTVFVMVNSGGLPEPWPLIIQSVGAAVAALLIIALIATVRSPRREPAVPARGGFSDKRYWLIVAAEVVALFGGLAVINEVLEAPDVSVAWIAVVVGTHFFALAWAWQMPMYHWLGAVMTGLGLGGFLAYAMGASAAVVALIAGVGSGFALFGSVVAGLRETRRRQLEPAA
ncbi:hypothetical protein OHA21_26450 [Actinoplanes sp. NBC_00393]|uniref:hypothetical protein n=1 Tax=Actinoplanes sp. NBC_00393 TaxID=2975953 RepID=UPI002E1DED72